MIPRKIHYCWFGGNPLPELARKCISSWKHFCPDYEIVEWNESNFDVNMNYYTREAYEAKRWAFVSDVARLYALVTEGGIYMDTDVELMKSLDELLEYEAFSGFESKNHIQTGLMGCQKGFPLFKRMLLDYDKEHFQRDDGTYNCTTNVARITEICLKGGLQFNNTRQTVQGFTIFPKEYFCPIDSVTGIMTLTSNTYAIHYFEGSWMSEVERCTMHIRSKYLFWLPEFASTYVAKFLAFSKCEGISASIRECAFWLKKRIEKK